MIYGSDPTSRDVKKPPIAGEHDTDEPRAGREVGAPYGGVEDSPLPEGVTSLYDDDGDNSAYHSHYHYLCRGGPRQW